VSWGEAAAMILYILPEMPRSCGKGWVVGIEHSRGSRITAEDWYKMGGSPDSPYRYIWSAKKGAKLPEGMKMFWGADLMNAGFPDDQYLFDRVESTIDKHADKDEAAFYFKGASGWVPWKKRGA
jgi:hypothetical protein